MLSPQKRRLQDQPLCPLSLCAQRTLCKKHHLLWILLILLVVCIAIQTIVVHQVRYDKLPNVVLQNVWLGFQSQTTLAKMQDVISAQNERNAKRLYQTGQNGNPETDSLSKYVTPNIFHSASSSTKRVSPGMFFPPDHLNKLKARLADSSTPGSKGKSLTTGNYRNHFNATFPSNVVQENITTVYTERKCLPESHIVFLKTHKTASSTILNVLYRYGQSRKLTFALPLNKQKQLFYPQFFASHFVEGFSGGSVKEFHIMCNHMRFKKVEVAKVMPADTFYFSIMRNPVTMMDSIYIYYKSLKAFQNTQRLDDFLDNASAHYNSSGPGNQYAHNILAFDFGFDNDVAADAADFEEITNRSIASIEQDFHLILISDYFEESMILLKHSLCWSLEDVLSFKLNSRSDRSRHPILASTAEKIKRWNALDWKIYMHFNRTFWHKVDSLIGREQIKVEVAQLKKLQADLAETCLTGGGPVNPLQVKDSRLKPFQYGSAVIQGYNLHPHLDVQTKTKCERLVTPELQYTDILYNQQFPESAEKQSRVAIHRTHSKITAFKWNTQEKI